MASPTNDTAEEEEEIAEMFYCLVPVMAAPGKHKKEDEHYDDTCTTTTTTTRTSTKLMLSDGSIASISSDVTRFLLTVREAETIRPGISKENGLVGHLANSLGFVTTKEGSVASASPRTSEATESASSRGTMANIVSPPAAREVVAAGGSLIRQERRRKSDLPGRNLFDDHDSSEGREDTTCIVGSQVEEVEFPSAPALVRSDFSCGRSGSGGRPMRVNRHPAGRRKRKRRRTKRQRGGVKRKSRDEVFSATSSEDDLGSDSSFALLDEDDGDGDEDEEMVYVEEEDEQEQSKPKRRSRGRPRRHRRIRKDEGDASDDNASASSSTSNTAVDIQLYCSWCREDYNVDDFSREQQDNRLDDSRFCLRHHNVGYQRPYGGTSSLRKLEKQFDDIGAKYADVGSDDDEVIEVDDSADDVIEVADSSDDGGGSDGDKNKDEDKAPVASSTRKRLCRLSRVADEESSDDEDDIDFCAGLSLETQPHGILDDDDEDGSNQRGTLGIDGHRARRCIAET